MRRLPPGILLSPDFPPGLGGVANYLSSIYSRFALDDITLIALAVPGAVDFDARQAYSALRIPRRARPPGLSGLSYVISTYRSARRLLKQCPDQVIHCGHIHAALAARLLKQRCGTRYLVWTYALEVTDRFLRTPIRSALLDADLVLTISDCTRRYLESLGVRPSRIVKIRPGTDPDCFRPDVEGDIMAQSLGIQGRRVLLTVGKVSQRQRYKGQDMVIRALPRIVQEVPDVVYVIAGTGDDTEYLLGIARHNNVSDHVKVIGPIDQADLPALYKCSDVFIMCSRVEEGFRATLSEGFGIVFLEANATSKPVIGGNSGGIPEAIQDGVTGLLVDPASPKAIAAAVINVMRDPELARRLGQNGRAWVEQEMNWGRAAREFWEAYERLFSIECDA